PTLRVGWLYPTPLGERVLPMACGVAPALRYERAIGPDATAHADVLAASDQEDALELELRDAADRITSTEQIAVIDTHYLESVAALPSDRDDVELDAEARAAVDEFIEEWERRCAEAELLENAHTPAGEGSELPQYQVYVTFSSPFHGP